ncbi:hypothetical protein [Aeromicrobium endophyticum]|uniref:Uncharacterized protein n=1 Tax=Aeromicrobium endophyticum TaxID=2292704 RepID=A0A371PCI1_9ACTN|nr:hypothetical protein [Aeromicrobium endophyticum]REK73645.1 hypothetical protein DX116_08955 [Aeromicrobium endophyticum]
MAEHVAAVKELLKPYGRPVHFGEAPGETNYPYVLLWASPGLLRAAELDGVQDDLDELLGVTTVAATSDAVLVAIGRVRGYLLGKSPQVEGRFVQALRLEGSQRVQPDLDVTIGQTNRHPSFGVDMLRLISEPV